jgi:hypothetical protein
VAQKIEGNVIADASAFLGGSGQVKLEDVRANRVLRFKTAAPETLFQFRADRDYKMVRCWCQTATCYVSRSAFTSSSDTAGPRLDQETIILSSAAIIYEVNMQLPKGEILYIDVAGSSSCTVVLRPLYETDNFDKS